MKIDVSIIILNYKTKNLIKQQIRSFMSQQSSCTIEIIVVDNNSHDGVGDMLAEQYPQVRFIASTENRGYAAGNNKGIAQALGDYLLISNSDIVLTTKMVDGLYRFMEDHRTVGIAGPKLINADGSLQISCLRFPDLMLPFVRRTFFGHSVWGKRWLRRYFMEDWDHQLPRDVDWLVGACLMVRRGALDTVGLLDQRFFLYLEDTDWCRRFWEHGWQVFYVPTFEAIHLLRRSSEGSLSSMIFNKTTRVHLKSFIRYLMKYKGKPNPHGAGEKI